MLTGQFYLRRNADISICAGQIIHRLYLVASELNGLTKSAVETAEKN